MAENPLDRLGQLPTELKTSLYDPVSGVEAQFDTFNNASRPAAGTVPVGYVIFNSDAMSLQRSNGTTWDSVGGPVGPPGPPGPVTTVTATPPITSTGGAAPDIGITPASGVTPGSMSTADFTKLAGISPGAAALTAAAPVNVTKAAAVVGVATDAARADHKHDVTTAAPVGIGTANAEGASAALARADHVHNTPFSAVNAALAAATSDIDVNAVKVRNAADPLLAQDLATKNYVDAQSAGLVPETRTLTAGAGLAGGGDLSANRSFAVQNTDGSIQVNADDIQVGVLQTDAQHGMRGGGNQHAVATPIADGFESAADKAKLDGISPGAAALTSTPPANVDKSAPVVGVATDAARADHKHDIVTAVAGSIAVGASAAEGTASSLSRSDHVHALAAPAAPVDVDGAAASAGVSANVARADHKHSLPSPALPADVTKTAAVAGTSNNVARSDHKHDVSTAAAGAIQVGDAAAEGTATSLARSDHKHSLAAPAAPANVTKAAASAGASNNVAREDHKHDVTTAAPGTTSIGAAAAEGTATSLSRSDHVHAVTAPAAPANVTKAAASAGASANMAREDHKHDVTTAAPSTIGTANSEGTATSLARSDHVHDRGVLPGSLLFWGSDVIGAAADTRFLTPGFSGSVPATASTYSLVVPRAGTIKNLYVRHNVAAGNGNSVVYTVQVNGVDTTITATLATGAVGQASDLTHSVAVSAGDRLDLKYVKASSIGTSGQEVTVSLELA